MWCWCLLGHQTPFAWLHCYRIVSPECHQVWLPTNYIDWVLVIFAVLNKCRNRHKYKTGKKKSPNQYCHLCCSFSFLRFPYPLTMNGSVVFRLFVEDLIDESGLVNVASGHKLVFKSKKMAAKNVYLIWFWAAIWPEAELMEMGEVCCHCNYNRKNAM